MSQQLDNVGVVMGRLIRVKNTGKQKFSNEKSEYISIQVEDADGKNERCLLFTERELKIADNRAKKNPEDLTHKSRIRDLLD
jgi:hypothetical protein